MNIKRLRSADSTRVVAASKVVYEGMNRLYEVYIGCQQIGNNERDMNQNERCLNMSLVALARVRRVLCFNASHCSVHEQRLFESFVWVFLVHVYSQN